MKLVLALLALAQLGPDFDIPTPRQYRNDGPPRMQRTDMGTSFAAFEAFPASGTGLAGACSTTAPTGARGEAYTFGRASNGTCSKKGVADTALANGDLVVLSSNQPRIEPGADGVLGVRIEPAHTNNITRSADICNAAWTDVGTPNCLANQAVGVFGTTTMAQITDDDGVTGLEGRSITIASTSLTRRQVSCYVKAGTATEASITLVGTGNSAGNCTGNVTGLSTTTSKRVSCISSTPYAAGLSAVTVTIRVGTVASVTGTIFVEACDDFDSSVGEMLSHVPTAGAPVAMAVENTSNFSGTSAPGLVATAGCSALTFTPLWDTTTASASSHYFMVMSGVAEGRSAYAPAIGLLRTYDGTNELSAAVVYSYGVAKRIITRWDTSLTPQLRVRDNTDNINIDGAYDGTWGGAGSVIQVGQTAATFQAAGIISRIQYDPSTSRCEP